MEQKIKEVADGPLGHSIITWMLVIGFAVLGGLVKWFNDYKEATGWNRKMVALTLATQIFTSGFVGILTFLACKYFQLSDTLAAVFIGVSGHMGAEAINVFKTGFSTFFQRNLSGAVPETGKAGGGSSSTQG